MKKYLTGTAECGHWAIMPETVAGNPGFVLEIEGRRMMRASIKTPGNLYRLANDYGIRVDAVALANLCIMG